MRVYEDPNFEGDTSSEVLAQDGEAQPDQTASSEVIEVPFKTEGGVKYVSVEVNGMPLNMILDTGCSTALISVNEANYLYNKGMLSEEDIMGTTQSQIADGSIVEDMVVNLREVVLGGKITCNNVEAVVSDNVQAPLLLGNEILDRAASTEIDNEAGVIRFRIR